MSDPNLKQEIIMCPNCNGIGKSVKMNKNGTPYLTFGKPTYEMCPVCNGHGRLIRVTQITYMRIPEDNTPIETTDKKGGILGWLGKKK